MLRLVQSGPAFAETANRPPSATGQEDALRPLLRAVIAGDLVATRTLLSNVMPSMLRVVRRVLGQEDPEIEDVLQEAAVGLLKACTGFRQDCTVLHFACRVAVLTSLAARRRRKREPSLLVGPGAGDGVEETPSGTPDPAHCFASARRRAILRELLDALSEVQGEALVLHCVLGYSIDEVARMTAVPANTARSRVRLAKDALRARVMNDPALCAFLRDES